MTFAQPLALLNLPWNQIKLIPRPLHDPSVLAYLDEKKYDVGLHGMGVIYRRNILNAFKRGILNSHIGKLPEMRGRAVFEWSIIGMIPTGITVFFMDEGVDTGKEIVIWKAVDRHKGEKWRQTKARLFSLDGQLYWEAVKELRKNSYRAGLNEKSQGQRYYPLSEMLSLMFDSGESGS